MSSSSKLKFGEVDCIGSDKKTFEIREVTSHIRFLSGKDCASVFIGTNGSTALAGSRPKKLYKVRRGQTVVFESIGRFAVSWAPIAKYRSAQRAHESGEVGSVKINRKTYRGTPGKLEKLVRRLAPKGSVSHISRFHRQPGKVREE